MNITEYIYQKDYEPGVIREYEQRLLSMGICDSFIPTAFIHKDEKEIAIYDYSGFIKINQCKFRSVRQILNLIEKTIVALTRSSEYLFNPSHMILSCETVFYNSTTEQIKIAYIPASGCESTARNNLINFIKELDYQYNSYTGNYLTDLMRFISNDNCSMENICVYIEKIKVSSGV